MFYRPGGAVTRLNAQYDYVFTDAINGATGWLPINKGDTIAVNIARARMLSGTPQASVISKSAVAPEAQILMELKMFANETDVEAWPADQWQNIVVATSRRAHRSGFVRLRVLNINSMDGDGVALALQVTRTGDSGAVT